jgi:hypothetical protein
MAVELHQCNGTSGDAIFNAGVTIVIPSGITAVPVMADTTIRARARTTSGEWSALSEVTLFIPPPDYSVLRVAEFMFAPIGGDNYAWIDLVNTSASPLDISGFSFGPFGADGTAIDWLAPAGTVLPAGGHLILARNATSFYSRHVLPPGALFYVYAKNFSRTSEPVTFFSPKGIPFFSFTYYNSWFGGAAFNTGRSLVAIDLQAPEPLWSTEANWRLSGMLNGSPGIQETPYFGTFAAQPGQPMLAIENGEFRVRAEGLERNFKMQWSSDLINWHDCPVGTVSLVAGEVRVLLGAAGVPLDRCFFRLVNP